MRFVPASVLPSDSRISIAEQHDGQPGLEQELCFHLVQPSTLNPQPFSTTNDTNRHEARMARLPLSRRESSTCKNRIRRKGPAPLLSPSFEMHNTRVEKNRTIPQLGRPDERRVGDQMHLPRN